MRIAAEIARDMRSGATFKIVGERIGIRRVERAWFNPASGHYVADCGSIFMWSDGPIGPWRCVPGSTPAERGSRADGGRDG